MLQRKSDVIFVFCFVVLHLAWKKPSEVLLEIFYIRSYKENSNIGVAWTFEALKLKNSRGSRNCMYKNVHESSSEAYALSNHDITFF